MLRSRVRPLGEEREMSELRACSSPAERSNSWRHTGYVRMLAIGIGARLEEATLCLGGMRDLREIILR
jgi:hypothetical protein